MGDEEIENLVEGTENENVDDFFDDFLDNAVKKRVDDVSISNDDVEEESVGDEFELRRRENGNDAPLFADKEKLLELTVIDPTPSSSSPKPKPGRFRRHKTFIQQMGGRYGYMFAHLKKHFMPRKSFHELARHLQTTMKEDLPSMVVDRVNEIAKKTVPLYKERENLRAEVTLQVNNAIANSIPPQVDTFLRNYMSNNILHIKFDKPAPFVAPCRTAAIRPKIMTTIQDMPSEGE
ncbi:probable aldo-keto reductase 2 [Tanacetum coccineum]